MTFLLSSAVSCVANHRHRTDFKLCHAQVCLHIKNEVEQWLFHNIPLILLLFLDSEKPFVFCQRRQSVYGFSCLCNTNEVNTVMSYGQYVRQISMKGVRHVCVWLYVCQWQLFASTPHLWEWSLKCDGRESTQTHLKLFTVHRLLLSRCAVSAPGKRRWDEGFLYGNVFYTYFATNHILQLAF